MVHDLNYCPACGSPLTETRIEGRPRKYCDACDQPVYRNPKPAAGVVVVDGDSVLLIQRTNPPAVGSWSLPAGFLEADEPPRDAAARELSEETNLSVDPAAPTLFDTTFVGDGEGPYVLVVVYAVDRGETSGEPVAGSDAGGVQFVSAARLESETAVEPGYAPLFRRAIREFGTRAE